MRLETLFLFSVLSAGAQSGELSLYSQSREDVQRTLSQCLASGGKRLTVVILPAGAPGPNYYGQFALGYGGQEHVDVSLPNPAFFQHLDWVISRATSKGIEIRLLPVDPESKVLKVNDEQRLLEFGRYLGRRYVKAKLLVWIVPRAETAGTVGAITEGIRQFDNNHAHDLQ